jgi:tetratricopeptide (TPR) repeat protein
LAFGYFKKGLIYEMVLNDLKSSTAEYEKVLQILKDILPNSWMVAAARGGMAVNCAREGNIEKAEQLLEELKRDLDRYGPSVHYQYWFTASGIEELKGNYDIARTYSEKLLKVQPYFWSRQLIGRNHLLAGRPEDAIRVYEKIIDRYEANRAYWPTMGVLVHFELGQAYEGAGRYEEAIKQYETFLDIWKNADEGLKFVEDAKARLANLKRGG